MGKNQEALDHFERITVYSHRYPPQFIEPDYPPVERLPCRSDGTPPDPSMLSRLDGNPGEDYYFAHLYSDLPDQSTLANLVQLSRGVPRYRVTQVFGLGARIRCAPTRAAFRA